MREDLFLSKPCKEQYWWFQLFSVNWSEESICVIILQSSSKCFDIDTTTLLNSRLFHEVET